MNHLPRGQTTLMCAVRLHTQGPAPTQMGIDADEATWLCHPGRSCPRRHARLTNVFGTNTRDKLCVGPRLSRPRPWSPPGDLPTSVSLSESPSMAAACSSVGSRPIPFPILFFLTLLAGPVGGPAPMLPGARSLPWAPHLRPAPDGGAVTPGTGGFVPGGWWKRLRGFTRFAEITELKVAELGWESGSPRPVSLSPHGPSEGGQGVSGGPGALWAATQLVAVTSQRVRFQPGLRSPRLRPTPSHERGGPPPCPRTGLLSQRRPSRRLSATRSSARRPGGPAGLRGDALTYLVREVGHQLLQDGGVREPRAGGLQAARHFAPRGQQGHQRGLTGASLKRRKVGTRFRAQRRGRRQNSGRQGSNLPSLEGEFETTEVVPPLPRETPDPGGRRHLRLYSPGGAEPGSVSLAARTERCLYLLANGVLSRRLRNHRGAGPGPWVSAHGLLGARPRPPPAAQPLLPPDKRPVPKVGVAASGEPPAPCVRG